MLPVTEIGGFFSRRQASIALPGTEEAEIIQIDVDKLWLLSGTREHPLTVLSLLLLLLGRELARAGTTRRGSTWERRRWVTCAPIAGD